MNSTAVHKVSQLQAEGYMAQRKPFKASALSGQFATAGALGACGMLAPEYRAQLQADVREHGRSVYLVLSYATPIAWHTPDGWRVPAAGYTMTTKCKHLPRVRNATAGARTAPVLEHADTQPAWLA